MSIQSMDALAEANRIRMARATLKHQIFDGTLTVTQVIQEVPREVSTMRLSELLRAQRRWGDQKTRRFLRSLQISEYRKVGNLTARERAEIALFLSTPWMAAA